MTTKPAAARAKAWPLGPLAAALLAALTATVPAAAQGPDCAHLASAAEKQACAEKDRDGLDDLITRWMAAAGPALADGARCLEADHQQWHEGVREGCQGDARCEAAAYRRRLRELDTLLTAVPPVTEAANATGGAPLEVSGALVYEQKGADNMGLAVRDKSGASHVIVLDMDIGSSPTHGAIRAAMRSGAKATYVVRGVKTPDGGFAMDRCRFLWREG